MYQSLRPLLFKLDAETAHTFAGTALFLVERLAPLREAWRRRFVVNDPRLATTLFGLHFPNPIGLAAGFDKDGRVPRALAALGFGYVEVGTVTAHPQPGNPAPRLFRLPDDEALINRMGFNNHGAAAMAEALRGKRLPVPLGVNLGKSKVTPNEEALADYLQSLEHVYPFADYLVINVSSPNTPGLRALQEKEPLRRLLTGVQARLAELTSPKKPLLLKVAPDLTDEQIDDIIELLQTAPVEGIIATNTTIGRQDLRTPAGKVEAIGAGGLSGKPVRQRSTEVIQRLSKGTNGKLPIIGVGGISTAEDVIEKFKAGASLVQIYTSFIYGGPDTVARLNRELIARMDRDGVKSILDYRG
jgi:dihydroorotate dehydrogenase